VQVAGFNQAYRSLIPESVAGPIPGSRFETFDLGLEQKSGSGTYLVLGAEALRSKADRDVGVFNFRSGMASAPAEKMQFEENSFSASVNQLLGHHWALGAGYKVSQAKLNAEFSNVLPGLMPPTENRALLHHLNLLAIYNHPCGLFGQAQALWTAQSNHGYSPTLPDDDFWQFNLFAGYRFPRRQAQFTMGVLNLASQDYRLNPLNLYTELPRHRTLVASFKFNF